MSLAGYQSNWTGYQSNWVHLELVIEAACTDSVIFNSELYTNKGVIMQGINGKLIGK